MRKLSMKRKSKANDLNSSSTSETKDVPSENESLDRAESDEDAKKNKKGKRSKKSIVQESNGTDKHAKNEKKSKKKRLSESTEDESYEVEEVLDEKEMKGEKYFLIRWKGYSEDSDTWEPESTLKCPDLIEKFFASKEKEAEPSKKKKRGKHDEKPEKAKKSKVKDGSSEDDEEQGGGKDFEVDRIIEVHHKKNGKREFLVHWKGYSQAENTWEPEENMNCPDLVDKFMAKVNKARELDNRELRVKPKPTNRFTLSMAQSGRRLSRRNIGKQRAHYFDNE